MTDQELRAEYARFLDRRGARDREGCPSPDQIRALVERQGAEAERLATLDHVMSCAACQKEMELFRAPRAAAAALERRRFPSWLAAAAMVALAVGAAWLWNRRTPRDGAEVTRGGSASVELVGPTTAQPGAPVIFVWRAVATAQRYQLELDTEAGDPVYATTTVDTTVRLPAGIHLNPGTPYRWWVRAMLASGTLVRSTALRLVPQSQ